MAHPGDGIADVGHRRLARHEKDEQLSRRFADKAATLQRETEITRSILLGSETPSSAEQPERS